MTTKQYPALTRRHKLVFAGAAAAAIALGIAIALARLVLIYWWLGNCPIATLTCRSAELAFEWWWTLLIAMFLAVGYVAHCLTRDRLVTRESSTPID